MSSSVESLQASVASTAAAAAAAAEASSSTSPSHTIEGNHLPLEDIPSTTCNIDAVEFIFGHRGEQCEEQTEDILPPYLEEPPAYSSSGSNEPVTLAMYMFKFGFIFPPFWILGSFILCSPLRQPESTPSSVWLPEKTEDERQEIIAKMRQTEVKWAKRCLVALCILLLLAVIAGLAIWGVLRS